MPNTAPTSNKMPESALLLQSLDAQFKAIALRITDDALDSMRDPEGGSGFVNYFLTDHNGSPLSEQLLKDMGLTTKQIEATAGYQKVKQVCDKKYYRLVFEFYLDFSKPGSPRLYKLTMDGW